MKKSKEKSFSVHILRISVFASFLSICVVGTFFYFEYQSQKNEKLFLAAQRLILSSEQQGKIVAASLMVQEEYDAIDLLKKDIMSQESLVAIQVSTSRPKVADWSASSCRQFENGGVACIDSIRRQISTLYQVKLGDQTLGYLVKQKAIEPQSQNEIENSMIALLAGLIVSTMIIFFFGRRFIYNRVRNPLVQMVDNIEPAIAAGALKTMDSYGVLEVEVLAEKLDKLVQRLKISQIKMVENEKDAAVGKIAGQVSHDIRSPLAALEMVSEGLEGVDEEKRVILRNSITRIRDIANSLVHKNKVAYANENAILEESTKQTEYPSDVTLLAPLIETIVSEKRMQYRNKLNLIIDFTQTAASYGLFCKVGPISFQRVISNLIDNSVEAMGAGACIIKIYLRSMSIDEAEVRIVDNGQGMTEEVLANLGKRGFTLGKLNGSGLGVFHARECVKAWGGRFGAESELGRGTQVSLTLKTQVAPSWFVPKLQLGKAARVIVFDDDQSIHHIWNERLRTKLPADHDVEVLHFSTASEVRKYYGQNFHDASDDIFLMDYELLGTSETGLDLIEGLGIQNQAILVTSHYENLVVRERCKRLNVKLIPKPMSGFVPVEVLDLNVR